MATWLDKMIGKVRAADSDEDAHAIVKDYIDPVTGERAEGGDPADGDTHVHIHLDKGEKGMNGKDELDPNNDPGKVDEPDAIPDNAEMYQMIQQLTQRVDSLEGDEEGEMELEDPDTKDARRFTYRRGTKMAARDEELTPKRNEEMMGETDLPGIEDLDKGMKSSDKKRVVDRAYKTRDSADMEHGWRDMLSMIEVIAPGMRLPTFDAAIPAARTAERMCAARRRAVDHVLKDKDMVDAVTELTGIKTVDGVPCDTVKVAFHALASAMRQTNNTGLVNSSTPAKTGDSFGNQTSGVPTNAEQNKVNREFWSNRGLGNGASRH